MKCISAITRRDIIDVICYGFVVVDDVEIKMTYWGRLDEIAFLQRIYPLAEMPSYDNRYASALGDALSRSLSPTLVSEYRLKLIDKKLLQRKLKEYVELAEISEKGDEE